MNTCVYLNLAAAGQRRGEVEASFAAAPHDGWDLDRFEAMGPAEAGQLPGSIAPAEKGCFASHLAAIERHLDDGGHLLVAEDDVQFSSRTFPLLEALLAHAPEWDVIFPDAALCDLALMLQLARRRDEMIARSEFNIVDLKGRSWAGATAYCVRASSKRKVFEALKAADRLDRPYDLHLRDLADRGVLKMGVCFPFTTTVSARAGGSQIQAEEHAMFDLTLAAYRRLMCVDRDLDQCGRDTARLREAFGDETLEMVGTIFASLASPAFPIDR